MSVLLRLVLLDLLRVRKLLPVLQPRLYTVLHKQASLGLSSKLRSGGVRVSQKSGALWERGLSLAWFIPKADSYVSLLDGRQLKDFGLAFDKQLIRKKARMDVQQHARSFFFNGCISNFTAAMGNTWQGSPFLREYSAWGGGEFSLVWSTLLRVTGVSSFSIRPLSLWAIRVPRLALRGAWSQVTDFSTETGGIQGKPTFMFTSLVEEASEPIFQTPALTWDAVEDSPALSAFDTVFTVDGNAETCRWLLSKNIVIFNSLGLVTQSFFFSNEVVLFQQYQVLPSIGGFKGGLRFISILSLTLFFYFV